MLRRILPLVCLTGMAFTVNAEDPNQGAPKKPEAADQCNENPRLPGCPNWCRFNKKSPLCPPSNAE